MASSALRREINLAVSNADYAAQCGEQLRRQLRRKAPPGAPVRQSRLEEQLEQLALAGARLRALSGKAVWRKYEITEGDADRLLGASAEVDRERRKLRKMLR